MMTAMEHKMSLVGAAVEKIERRVEIEQMNERLQELLRARRPTETRKSCLKLKRKSRSRGHLRWADLETKTAKR